MPNTDATAALGSLLFIINNLSEFSHDNNTTTTTSRWRQRRCTILRKIRGKIQIPNGKSKINFQICAVQFVSKCSMYSTSMSLWVYVSGTRRHTHTYAHVRTCTTCARVSVCLEYWESGKVDFSSETVRQEDSSKLISENSESKSGTTKKRRRERGRERETENGRK